MLPIVQERCEDDIAQPRFRPAFQTIPEMAKFKSSGIWDGVDEVDGKVNFTQMLKILNKNIE